MKFNSAIAWSISCALAIGPVVSRAQDTKIVLEQGTPVELVLSETVSSADARVGNAVPFEVIDDVKVGDVVVIPRGAMAWATITVAEPKKRMGRAGKIDMNIDKVRLADGEKVLLSATKGAKGGSHTAAMTGAIVATSLILWPAAPLFLLMHGKDITIPKGTKITAFVSGDATLEASKFTPAGLAPKPVQAVVAAPVPTVAAAVASSPAATQPVMTTVDANQQSLGDLARQYREKKVQEQGKPADANTSAQSTQP